MSQVPNLPQYLFMCGIAGGHNRALVEAIVESQRRRGPDFQCVKAEGNLFLGHDRLKIIDLSSGSDQPFVDCTGQFAITYNGEIYNYLELRRELEQEGCRFRTQGDVEVLVEALKVWGDAALQKLNGMFVFGFYDLTKNRLTLVRDRFGVKPLYYFSNPPEFAFASSTRALAKHFGLAPNLDYLQQGITRSIFETDSDDTIYNSLKCVPPGCKVIVEPNQPPRIERYYDLSLQTKEASSELAEASSEELSSKFCHLLDSSIDLRLRSDVPIGISLSGGLDSTSIAALAKRRLPQLQSFTYGEVADTRSESPIVKQFVDQLGIKSVFVTTSKNDLLDLFEETLRNQNAPFASISVVAQSAVFQAARASGIVVMLGGQGADEAFMGYRKFNLFHLKSLRKKPREFLRFGASLTPMIFAELPSWRTYWRARNRYLKEGHPSLLKTVQDTMELGMGVDPSTRQLLDITRFSLPTLLRYEDSSSMGHSVESRLPFLDYRLVEFGLGLATRHKLQNGFGKWIVRKALKGVVPDNIRLARFKRGFDVSLKPFLENDLGKHIRSRLLASKAALAPFLCAPLDVDNSFSDDALLKRPNAFCEATTLLWLADS